MSELPVFKLERVFKAPRHVVWQAWANPEFLARWYGPGVETVIHEFDLKVGGVWRNEMRMKGKDGGTMSDYSLMTFTKVQPEDNITLELASTDENWQPRPSQMMPDWPQLFFTEFAFDDDQDGETTKVTLTQTPINASAAEITCFANMMPHMGNGWGSGFTIIEDIVAELQT